MTVLHLMQCTNLGGMEQVTFRLMDRLAARGISFRIATPRPFGPGVEHVRRFDPKARDFPYRGRFGWRDFPAFRAHVRSLAAECGHIWVTGTSAAALAAIKGLSRPKLLSHHYHHFEGRWAWLRWRAFYELLCRDVDAVTYPTGFTYKEALRVAPWLSAKAHVVHNGVDVHCTDEATTHARRIEARRTLGLPENALVVGNAGWLVSRKRFDVFLHVAARVRARVPGAIFVICGGGVEEGSLRRLASDLGLGDSVRFMGWTVDLLPHYRSWDALLFNTDFDTMPSTPMEAAAEGCVLVMSQTYGGLGELVEHRRGGYLFPTHDVEALSESLLEVHADPALAERLRQVQARKLRSDFALGRAADFYADFFMGSRPSAGGGY